MTAASPRHWAIAALGGAYAVIVPVVLAFAGWRVVETRALLERADVFDVAAHNAVPYALTAGLTGLAGALLVCSLVGLPVALLLAGFMAMLERRTVVARSLWAWLAAGLTVSLPLAALAVPVFGATWAGLPFVGFALIGAAVAWVVRHRTGARQIA